MRVFWGAQQRFFKELAVNAKLPWLIRDIKREVNENNHHCVVGLQTTGEAGTLQTLALALERENTENHPDPNRTFENLRFKKMISTCGGILISFLRNNFPVKSEPIVVPPEPAPLPVDQPCR